MNDLAVTPRIDAHQHFWALDRGDYGWLTPALGPLWRDYGPDDLAPLLAEAGLDGTVLVQAAPTAAETEWMLTVAVRTPFVRGVVGWIDFEEPAHRPRMARWAAGGALVGLRPMLQDLPDDAWLLRPSLAGTVDAMMDHGLAFDALVKPRHLPHLLRFAERYPALRIVIDHAAKPDIAGGVLEPWASDIRWLARDTACVCKVSGLLTEAEAGADDTRLAPWLDVLADAFGPERLMFGSDWPVLIGAGDYADWAAMARRFATRWSPAGQAAFFGGTATAFYGLRG